MRARLYRSRTDRMLGGVCGGLGQYLGVDPTLVRLVFVLVGFGTGVGLLLYPVMWIVVPVEGQGVARPSETIGEGAREVAEQARNLGETVSSSWQESDPQAARFLGGALVVLGAIFLIQNLHIPWLRWINFDLMWPILLVFAGVLLMRYRSGTN